MRARSSAGQESPRTYSGAPRIRAVPSLKVAADFLRSDEKGTTALGFSVPGLIRARIAFRVGLWSSKAQRKRLSAHSVSASVRSTPSTRESSISPVVMVPVLSRQSTSARARVSMPASSCTSVFLRPSLITPTAMAMLVSRIRPSGIMPIMAATESGTAVFASCTKGMGFSENHWLTITCFRNSRTPSGTSSIVSNLISRFSSSIRREPGRAVFFASLFRRPR